MEDRRCPVTHTVRETFPGVEMWKAVVLMVMQTTSWWPRWWWLWLVVAEVVLVVTPGVLW